MRLRLADAVLGIVLMTAAATCARADVCLAVDEAHDTLSPQERTAATLILARQFELAGEHVVEGSCPALYTVSHIALGRSILVKLSGPGGTREGSALGVEDLPALYNQMVRSIMTGRPMSGFNVIDRTNVTAEQASAERVSTDGFWYARLGYGAIFGDNTYGTPAVGFGYRVELDSFGVDVSFFNYLVKSPDRSSYYGYSNGAYNFSLLKLEGLYFINPKANKTLYAGGGLSWGGTSFGDGWSGSGLQGELTAGYELPRASTLRVFLQADALLPFYSVSSVSYGYYPVDPRRVTPVTVDRRYAPSLTMSVGLGWQRGRHHSR